ncbi:MAG: alpha/beta hydrolase [Anaerolineaceae bacterium]|nr:alpha/beta hydrolase [Anaerolineaceae bacterium]
MSSQSVEMIQKNPYSMQVFEIESPEIGDKFVVRVSVPASYEMAADAKYPLLVVLDGDAAMGLARTTLDYINLGNNFGLGKNVPDMIVVGIGYERGAIPWLFTRVRDFTQTVDETFNYNNPNFKIPASGGAAKFYDFLVNTIMPTVRANFRVDESMAMLAGHSMGGLFAMYAMLQPNPVFQKYLMASPFVGWGEKAIFKMEEAFAAANKAINADVFFSYCPIEPTPTYIDEVKELYKVLTDRKYDGLHCTMKEYPSENHFSVYPKAFSEGLYALFEK